MQHLSSLSFLERCISRKKVTHFYLYIHFLEYYCFLSEWPCSSLHLKQTWVWHRCSRCFWGLCKNCFAFENEAGAPVWCCRFWAYLPVKNNLCQFQTFGTVVVLEIKEQQRDFPCKYTNNHPHKRQAIASGTGDISFRRKMVLLNFVATRSVDFGTKILKINKYLCAGLLLNH